MGRVPPFRASSMLMCPNYTTVDVMDFPINAAFSIRLLLQLSQYLLPQPTLLPGIKPTGDR